MEIYTIGFTRKSAANFFDPLKKRGIKRLVDVRVSNTSQLAGFTKRDDLAYFLRELVDADYLHETMLAPSPELLKDYRSGKLSWEAYEQLFLGLLAERKVEDALRPQFFLHATVLLCSEATAERCHRRLIVQYLDRVWGEVQAVHL
jgi:uncharacterized protein (DUF488 family)